MNRLISENSDVAESLDLVYRLHALNTIQNNLSTLTMSGVISLENAKLVNIRILPVFFNLFPVQVKSEFNALCTKVADICPELVTSFGIPEELLSAPIARDWQGFNQFDNRGEVQPGVF